MDLSSVCQYRCYGLSGRHGDNVQCSFLCVYTYGSRQHKTNILYVLSINDSFVVQVGDSVDGEDEHPPPATFPAHSADLVEELERVGRPVVVLTPLPRLRWGVYLLELAAHDVTHDGGEHREPPEHRDQVVERGEDHEDVH